MATYQVREDENGQKILSDPLSGLSGTLATSETPGAVQPDNVTTKVDSQGIMSVLGGNLLLNSEEWVTESGDWIAPVTGWYDILAIDGGSGSRVYYGNTGIEAGNSGAYKHAYGYFNKGDEIPIAIGTGGIGYITPSGASYDIKGGITTVGDIDFSKYTGNKLPGSHTYFNTSTELNWSVGGGFGGGVTGAGYWYGGGGAALKIGNNDYVYNGMQGAVRICYYDPTKS